MHYTVSVRVCHAIVHTSWHCGSQARRVRRARRRRAARRAARRASWARCASCCSPARWCSWRSRSRSRCCSPSACVHLLYCTCSLPSVPSLASLSRLFASSFPHHQFRTLLSRDLLHVRQRPPSPPSSPSSLPPPTRPFPFLPPSTCSFRTTVRVLYRVSVSSSLRPFISIPSFHWTQELAAPPPRCS